MTRGFSALAALAIALLCQTSGAGAEAVPPAGSVAAVAAACPPASEAASGGEALPHVKAALAKGGTLAILAVGAGMEARGGSAGGAAAGSPSGSGFLAQFGRAMQTALPGLHVVLTVKGGRGELAGEQVALMRDALKAHRYALVLWETGTTDAVQGEPLEDFSGALADGADAADGAGADLVLIEPQYSHFLEANADLGPYLSSMGALGAEHGTMVFERFGLMQGWEDDGAIDLEHAAAAQRPAIAARLHGCLAGALARAVLSAVDAGK